MTVWGIEPATFRLVAQCHSVLPYIYYIILYYIILYYIIRNLLVVSYEWFLFSFKLTLVK